MSDRQRPLRPRGRRAEEGAASAAWSSTRRPPAASPPSVRSTAAQKTERPAQQQAPAQTGPIKVNSGATVKGSPRLGVSVPEIIKIMMNVGEMVTITQTLSDEAIELIATESKSRSSTPTRRSSSPRSSRTTPPTSRPGRLS